MNVDRVSGLLSDVEIAGTILFRGHLTFSGKLQDGDIVGEDLVVGPMAVVQGNIKVTSLDLQGSVIGEVVVTGRCEIKGTASLTGSLTANRLIMQEGAAMTGGIVVTREPPKPAAS